MCQFVDVMHPNVQRGGAASGGGGGNGLSQRVTSTQQSLPPPPPPPLHYACGPLLDALIQQHHWLLPFPNLT